MNNKKVLVLILFTIISKLIGFFREVTLAYYYGASKITDAYLTSRSILFMVVSLLSVGISASIIPMYNNIKVNGGEGKARNFILKIVKLVAIVSFLMLILILVFTDKFVYIIASGFKGELLTLTIKFTRIAILSLPVILISSVLNGYLQAQGKFNFEAFSGIILNLILILFTILSSREKTLFLPIGLMIAHILQYLPIYIYLSKSKTKSKYKGIKILGDSEVRIFIKKSIPLILGLGANQIATIVDKNIASFIGDGAISFINYSSRIFFMILATFVIPLSTIYFNEFSKNIAEKDICGLSKSVDESIGILNFIMIPVSLGLLVYSKQIISLIYYRGEFLLDDVLVVYKILRIYGIGILFESYNEIFTRLMYANSMEKTTMKFMFLTNFVNLLVSLILYRIQGIYGIIMGTLASILVRFILNYRYIRKNIVEIKIINKKVIKIFINSVISIIGIRYLIYPGNNLMFLKSCIFIVLLYLIFSYIFKVEEMRKIINEIKIKL